MIHFTTRDAAQGLDFGEFTGLLAESGIELESGKAKEVRSSRCFLPAGARRARWQMRAAPATPPPLVARMPRYCSGCCFTVFTLGACPWNRESRLTCGALFCLVRSCSTVWTRTGQASSILVRLSC